MGISKLLIVFSVFFLLVSAAGSAQNNPVQMKNFTQRGLRELDIHKRFQETTKKLEEAINKGENVQNYKKDLDSEIQEYEAKAQVVRERFQKVEKEIAKIGTAKILARQRKAKSEFEKHHNDFKVHLDELKKAAKGGSQQKLKDQAKKASDFIISNQPVEYHLQSSESRLPWSVAQPGEIMLLGNASAIPVQGAPVLSTEPPCADELSTTSDVQITPEIQALAAGLDKNPLKIFKYIYNNYRYTPYFGAMKGSLDTYYEKEGNDYDLASLCLALFRASGIPARYVKAKIAVPVEDIQKWLGLNDAMSTVQYLSEANIRVGYYTQGGRISHVGFDHIYVEAYLPYTNYRGTATDNTGLAWVPLDPSFKHYQVLREGVDMTADMELDWKSFAMEYWRELRNCSPIEFYRSKVEQYLATHNPGKTIDSLKRQIAIKPMQFEFLPNTLSYTVLQVLGRYAALPQEQKHTITFVMPSVLEYSTTLPEIAGRRITLSFEGATPEDQAVINHYGSIFKTPPYLIEVKPVLRINGLPVATGKAVGTGGSLGLVITYTQAGGKKQVFSHTVTTGSYNAVGITIGQVRPEMMDISQVEESPEPYLSKMLHSLVMKYHHSSLEAKQLLNDTMKTTSRIFFTEALVSTHEDTGRVYGNIATNFALAGFKIDAQEMASAVIPIDGFNSQKTMNYAMLDGLEMSYQENKTFEDSMFWVSGLSAVKGLQILNAMGIGFAEIKAPNNFWHPDLPEIVNNDINNALNQGWNVFVPMGTGGLPAIPYIKYDPKTGSAGYMISTAAGGFNAYLKLDPQLLDTISLSITWPGPKMLMSSDFVPVSPSSGTTIRLGDKLFVQFKLVLKWKEGNREWTEELMKDSNGGAWGFNIETGPGLFSPSGVPLPWWNPGHYEIKYNGKAIFDFYVCDITLKSDAQYIGVVTPNGTDYLSKLPVLTYSITNTPTIHLQTVELKVYNSEAVVIRTKSLPLTTGENQITDWDGKAGNGQLVAPGIYGFVLEVNSQEGLLKSEPSILTIFKVELDNPRGDPVSAPKDYVNEFTYNFADPGVLQVDCKAKVSPEGNADLLRYLNNNKIRWSITSVGSSVLAWTSAWTGDATKGNGIDIAAQFTGLPVNNSDFGKKTVTMEVFDDKGAVNSTTTTIEVFFPKSGTNHTGGQADSPNWFYYWLQAIGGRPNTEYGAHSDWLYGYAPGISDWDYAKPQDKKKIVINDLAATEDQGVTCVPGGQMPTTGIDTFENIIIHEDHHTLQVAKADAVVGIIPNTPWRYGWSWNSTLHNHWSVGRDGKPGRAGIDDDGDGSVDNWTVLGPGELGSGDDALLSNSNDPKDSWPLAFGPLPNYCQSDWSAIEADAYASMPGKENKRLSVDWANPGKQHATMKYDD